MLTDIFRKITDASWSKPLFIFAIVGAAWGIFLPKLGYYQDDWNHIYIAHTQGLSSLWDTYFTDARPLTAWVHTLGFKIFGLRPIWWHLSSFLLRFLTVLLFGLCLEVLWPKHRIRVLWMTLFFCIYPLFSLQAMAVTYLPHWISYLFFLASLYLMILALNHKGNNATLWIGSVLLSVAHLFTIEYYAGLELIRPLIIAFFIPDEDAFSHKTAKLRFILRRWGLYLLGFLGFVYYRIIIIPEISTIREAPTLIYGFFNNPFDTVVQQVGIVLQDLVWLSMASWSELLRYEMMDISRSANIKILLIVLISAAGIFIFMSSIKVENQHTSRQWFCQALILGSGGVLLGTIPAWVVGVQITAKNPHWSSRFGLPATFGLAILVVVVLELALNNRYRVAVFSLFIALAIGWHINNLNNFRWSWEEQVEFYRQLLWRAPSIEKGTVLLSAGEFLNFMGDYPLSFALNSIYTYKSIEGEAGYWYADIEDFRGEVGKDFVFHKKYTILYEGPSSESLVVQFNPEKGQCLWMLTPENVNPNVVHSLAVEAAEFTKLTRIKPTATQDLSFLEELLNGEYTDTQTWCYFYQKGDLAAQYQQWGEAANYWEEASSKGFRPSNGIEFIPFIKTYLYLENYDQAISLTRRSLKTTKGMRSILCNLWHEVETNQSSNHAFVEALIEANALIGCGQ